LEATTILLYIELIDNTYFTKRGIVSQSF